jgi:hypothetical protein
MAASLMHVEILVNKLKRRAQQDESDLAELELSRINKMAKLEPATYLFAHHRPQQRQADIRLPVQNIALPTSASTFPATTRSATLDMPKNL